MTISLRPVLFAQALGQASLALVLVLVFAGVPRASTAARTCGTGRSAGWRLVVYIGGAVASLRLGSDDWLARAGLSAFALVAAYLQVAWLLLGTLGLARDERAGPSREPDRARRGGLRGARFACGVRAAHVGRPSSAVGVRCLVAGLTYLYTAAVLGRGPGSATVGPDRRPRSPSLSTRPTSSSTSA